MKKILSISSALRYMIVSITIIALTTIFQLGYSQGTYCEGKGDYQTIQGKQVFVCPLQGASSTCYYYCGDPIE